MNGSNRLLAAFAAAALIVALALGAFAAWRPSTINVTVPGSGNGSNSPVPGLTVTGSATVHAVPDIAIFDFGVSSTAPTVSAARAAAATAANASLDALRRLGIADQDITTTSISLYRQYPTCPTPLNGSSGASGSSSSAGGTTAPDGGAVVVGPIASPVAPPSILPNCTTSGYTFSESFEVTIRVIDNLGGAIDAITAVGTTDISGIRFSLADNSAPEAKARSSAVTDAHARAETLASAAGAKLGMVLSMSESSSNPFVYWDTRAVPAAAGSSSTPVSPGTLDVTVSVTITYALNQ